MSIATGAHGELRRTRGWQPQRPGFSKYPLEKYRTRRNKQFGLTAVRFALTACQWRWLRSKGSAAGLLFTLCH